MNQPLKGVANGMPVSFGSRNAGWLLCIAALFMCGRSALAATPLPEIKVAVSFDTPTTEPGHPSRTTTTDDLMMQLTESLVAFRSDGTVAPMLADSWTISADGKRYTFKLRKGVTFVNGAPMTSAEVKWSMEHILDPKAEVRCRSVYDGSHGLKVESIETPASDTVVFNLNKPYALLLEQMASPQCPFAILHPDSVDKQGAWIKPIGTGPYMLGEWKKGESIELLKYDGYASRTDKADGAAGEKHVFANVRFVLIPDSAAQKSALMSGQVDIIPGDVDNMPPKDPRWSISKGSGISIINILMQTKDPLLSDVRMRRAIASAIDFPTLVKVLTEGEASYNPSVVPQVSSYYDAAEKTGYAKDMAQTKSLLAAAGYHGQVIKLQTNVRFGYMYRQAVIAQQMLQAAGLNVQLEVLEWATQENNFRQGKFQLMSFSYSARMDPALMYGDLIGDKSRTPMVQWENKKAEALLTGIEGVTDKKTRQDAFDNLHKLMIDDVPILNSYNENLLTVVSSKVHGFSVWPLNRFRLFNVKKD
jgi:peptide/nickel transport system substrate-binding protein